MLIYIGAGSNLGNRQENIQKARSFLNQKSMRVLRVSPLYETEALCRPGQTMPAFLNGVFEVETNLDPEELLSRLEQIEKSMGRIKKGDWQPRSIDLDILLYGDQVIFTDRLKIPHPGMDKRWFVLKPLSDLAPDLVHPVGHKSIQEMVAEVKKS